MASHDEKAKKHVVIYAPASMSSHLVSMEELGELLAAHGLKVTVAIGGRTGDEAAGSFAAALPELSFRRLPPVTCPPTTTWH